MPFGADTHATTDDVDAMTETGKVFEHCLPLLQKPLLLSLTFLKKCQSLASFSILLLVLFQLGNENQPNPHSQEY